MIEVRTAQDDKSRDELLDEVVDLILENEKLKEEKEKLEKELKKYKNPHTPSSQKKFSKVEVQGLKVGRKKGKKTGHKGRTRAKEKPINTIDVTVDENPRTGNKNIEETGYVEEVTITDFEIINLTSPLRSN